MEGKKTTAVVKLQITGGQASPAPPVGPVLGQHGVNIMDFCKAFNDQTKDKKGITVPVVLTIYEDRTFSFITKTTPTSELIKKSANIVKGSGVPNREKVGQITREKIREIAKEKMVDLNVKDLDKASKIIEGSAKSMGIEVVEKLQEEKK
jgi:large subunit ribosomal protein L11